MNNTCTQLDLQASEMRNMELKKVLIQIMAVNIVSGHILRDPP